ncbi:MAG: inositol monophosphatase family protein [Bacteroidia bacterium]
MNLENICKQTIDIAKKAGNFIKKESEAFNKDAVEIKSFNQLVSYVDKTSEEILVDGLSQILPEAGFITEENTIASLEKVYMWVIDPLDGTTNFVHQIPVYSISIGLLHHRKPVVGVVYEINRNEMFYAWKNGGAFLNGNKILVKQNYELKKALLATGFPYYDFDIMDNYLTALKYLMSHTQGMRRMGSAAVDLAYTACGRFDGFFEYGLSPWDVAAGVCLIEEAGGIVKDFNGGDDYIFGRTILGSSSNIYNQFSEVIKNSFSMKK